jgi:hypothetical protein
VWSIEIDATISGDERGEQCVQRALAWGNAIWVTWLDPEPGSSVLQQNAGPRCHQAHVLTNNRGKARIANVPLTGDKGMP